MVAVVLVPAGECMMGALHQEEAYFYEDSRHKVEKTKDFYVDKYPVSKKLWKAVMGGNPSESLNSECNKDSS